MFLTALAVEYIVSVAINLVMYLLSLEYRIRLGMKNKFTCFVLHSPFTI